MGHFNDSAVKCSLLYIVQCPCCVVRLYLLGHGAGSFLLDAVEIIDSIHMSSHNAGFMFMVSIQYIIIHIDQLIEF